jgi:hypothetical protein
MKEKRPSATLLHAPNRKSSFSCCRIILDPVDRLSSKPCGPCDLADTLGIAEHRLRALELLATVARLTTSVGASFTISLRVCNPDTLRFFSGFCLGLGSRGHESDERVADCALHGVLGRAVKRDAVDDSADRAA